ncbi:MAG: SWIM zinc finger domain-containing protein [Terriglobia bacterium]
MASASLEALLKPSSLLRLAGPRSFERGKDYFESGQVQRIFRDKDEITATVTGTHPYRVKLSVIRDGLDYSCSCPMGQDGNFCKHCVATALAATEKRAQSEENGRGLSKKDIRDALEAQDKDDLVNLLLESADNDDRLQQRLWLMAAKRGKQGFNLAAFRRAIDQAINVGGFVDYHSMYAYSSDVESVVDSIETLLREGHPHEVIELCEHALAQVEEVMNSMDDSDGYMGGILENLQEIHFKACQKARPDPIALARRLFEWELSSGFGVFSDAVQQYAKLLGKEGLAAYRKLAEEAWSRIPAKTQKSKDSEAFVRDYGITRIMENLATVSGNADELIAIKSRDLSSAYHFLQIAKVLKDAKRRDEALDWAERGLKAFPERADPELRRFVAEEYHRRKRIDEAMELIWSNFQDRLDLEFYKELRKHAERVGQWAIWRERALTELHGDVASKKQKFNRNQYAWYGRRDHSVLVEVFLYEHDEEGAWHEAQEGDCSQDLWLKLASLRERKYPADAAAVYLKFVEPALLQKNNLAYAEAVDLLRKAKSLMVRMDRAGQFAEHLNGLRMQHKAKRNFMRLLEKSRL